MDKILVTILNGVGGLPEKGIHWVLDRIEAFVTSSEILVDNVGFYKIVAAIKSWTPKNPTE